MRITRNIMTAPALDGIVTGEITPGVDMDDDAELLQWVKENAETTYHPVGTCKMGHDPMAVVDDQLRVHGIEGLRVADASIMPTLTSGNTNAPSIMIGDIPHDAGRRRPGERRKCDASGAEIAPHRSPVRRPIRVRLRCRRGTFLKRFTEPVDH